MGQNAEKKTVFILNIGSMVIFYWNDFILNSSSRSFYSATFFKRMTLSPKHFDVLSQKHFDVLSQKAFCIYVFSSTKRVKNIVLTLNR